MIQIQKKVCFSTELNADSVEWCPVKNYRHVFVCGTYQLCESESENTEEEDDVDKKTLSQRRKGHLYLFQLVSGPEVIKLLDKIAMAGILDSKWAHREIDNNVLLAIATAQGELRIYKLLDAGALSLEHIFTHKLNLNPATLALSLDWSTGVNDLETKILVSDSGGFITLVNFGEGEIKEECKWKLHNFQAWIVAFNYWNTNLFYSGGDDCKMFIYDRRSNTVQQNSSGHTAGITSMHMNMKDENLFISGSYDEKVAFWDVRQMNEPTDSLSMGGGLWRLKWEPHDCENIAAACMHNGFATIDGTKRSILTEYKEEHSSLGYGIDWSHLEQDEICKYFYVENSSSKKLHLLAACSFYDNLLSIALFEQDK